VVEDERAQKVLSELQAQKSARFSLIHRGLACRFQILSWFVNMLQHAR